MQRTKCGIIGCGMISDTYFKAAKRFRNIEVTACADLIEDRAKAKAAEHNVRFATCEELLNDPVSAVFELGE